MNSDIPDRVIKWIRDRMFAHRLLLKKVGVIASLVTLIIGYSQALSQEIRFAPLPLEDSRIMHEQFHGLVHYLSRESQQRIEMVFYTDYGEILQRFKHNKIDLAYLGPLPFALLSEAFDSAEPIGCFREPDGKTNYSCSLVTYGENNIDLNQLGKVQVGLTQPYSTCGYLAVSQMLEAVGRQLDEPDINFIYAGSHTKAALGAVRGKYDLAGVKTSIALRYQHLNLQVLSTSRSFPGMVLVANSQTLSSETIDRLQDALLKLDPQHTPQHSAMMQNWGGSLKNGVVPSDQCSFNNVHQELERMPRPIPGTEN
ncbi:MAG: PhnD/SsuA/transferrin family substrate-binding protein [Candidatus Thiodiazotropha sp.]|nr:PhnD/SsuA/transferrin family substrate-binding protein [Candidatus Thiodiazotropha sp.]MCM8885666.1 PhnD/SsuA/transferrin family substrate-binding protein [Candidatus Thiodiazotropha sp.]MCM8922312.1 PhnD/SsuA/transferrin family substrate-binding protein [Candidatus Thiodiazotropha sp.]